MAKNNEVATEDENKVVVKADREKYVSARSASGSKSLHSNDEVAQALEGADVPSLYVLTAELLGVDEKELQEKYQHLNIGMQRMNLGNRIRGFIGKTDKANEGADKPGKSGLEIFTKTAAPMVKAIATAKAAAAKEVKKAA